MSQLPFIFQPRPQIRAYHSIQPSQEKGWKVVILWYVLNHPLSTYEDVYSGLVALGYKIKQATCVGRLSDMSTRQEKPFLDMERDGKMTRYRINDEGVKYLEGKQ